jgi:hypothetical protein
VTTILEPCPHAHFAARHVVCSDFDRRYLVLHRHEPVWKSDRPDAERRRRAIIRQCGARVQSARYANQPRSSAFEEWIVHAFGVASSLPSSPRFFLFCKETIERHRWCCRVLTH